VRVDNLTWHPVRLGMRRVRPNTWWISREDEVVGEVARTEEGWVSVRGRVRELDDGRRALMWDHLARSRHPSFVSAVLRVARLEGIWASSDGPQDFGTVRMLRVSVASRWYTVVARGEDRYIYEDFTIPKEMTDEQQAVLRRAVLEAERVFGEEG
jgi:hypothetical protein